MGISLQSLTVVYRDREGKDVPVLDIRALEIPSGAQRCVVGGSGSGKTTLLNTIAGIVLPTSGAVLYNDVDITKLREAARDRFRAEHVGYIFQTFNLLPSLSARENVAIAQTFAGKGTREATMRATSLLERVGLSHRLDSKPATLSVGEQQRVAIARAVANKPTIVLADEPTANLDEARGDEVLELLKETAGAEESILLLVTHEARVKAHFDEVVELSELSA